MAHQLTFKTVYDYDQMEADITLPVVLRSGDRSWEAMTKLDCGSTFCVFQRIAGERLGFDIESGTPQWIRCGRQSLSHLRPRSDARGARH